MFFTNILLENKITVPSIKGELDLYLRKDMRDKEHYTFPSKGIKDVRSSRRGDFIVQLKIIYPKNINRAQKELISQLHDSFSSEHSKHTNGLDNILDKIKGWFN